MRQYTNVTCDELTARGSDFQLPISCGAPLEPHARPRATGAIVATDCERGKTMAVDPEATAFHKFAKQGIPRTYVISRDGTILFQTIGFADELDVYKKEFERLRRTIKKELMTTRE